MKTIANAIKNAIRVQVEAATAEDPSRAAARAQTLFFVSGHPRSGTNWVSALLNLHPHVFCDGEFHFHILRKALDGFTSLPWYLASDPAIKAEAESAFHDLVRRCLAAQAAGKSRRKGKPGATVIGDHTPRMMEPIVPPPRGRYIVIFRDGRDVLVSWTFHLLKTAKPEVVQEPIRPVLADAVRTLDGSTDSLHATARRLLAADAWVAHFAAQWSNHVLHDLAALERLESAQSSAATAGSLRLSYEKLHADTDGERARIYRFLGVDPALAAPLSDHTHTRPGFGREDPKAFYRKGEVGDWKNYVSPAFAGAFQRAAGAALVKLGYEQDGSWVTSTPAAVAAA